MSEEVRKYTDIYNEYFKGNNYNLLNLQIIDEIQCQLTDKISDEDYNTLFYTIKNCYLKSDSADLWCLTNYCIRNKDKIKDMSTYDIIDNSFMLS